jgi:hypothetical protein
VSVTAVSRTDALRHDFALACADLAEARRAQQAKDTPAARARLDECARKIDVILDMSNGRPWDRD